MRADKEFSFLALTPNWVVDPAIAIAACRAGAIGVLDLEYASDLRAARPALDRFLHLAPGQRGVKLDPAHPDLPGFAAVLPDSIGLVVLAAGSPDQVAGAVRALAIDGRSILLEATGPDMAFLGRSLGLAGLVAKGNEAGGIVAEETSFILLQRLCRTAGLPVFIHGGIGLHSARACEVAGAAGIILDSQLVLSREAGPERSAAAMIRALDGSEAEEVPAGPGTAFRLLPWQCRLELDTLRVAAAATDPAHLGVLRKAVRELLPGRPVLLGQDGALARPLADRFVTVAGVIEGIRSSMARHASAAVTMRPLTQGGPLAAAYSIRWPIVQGPMTRVSDTPAFARAVADNGALPFVALAMLRGAEAAALLEETAGVLQGRPWGAGILGFVPEALRQEQLAAVRQVRPACVLIAGGRPEQAQELEQAGIPTWLHVPSPTLLRAYVEQGVRRFVFEGRECGGHVGPRSSLVLWDTMVSTLLEALPPAALADCEILFAGGIHDEHSSAMATSIAAPLVQAGAKFGVLLGSAYLFTEEAVATGAITPAFQERALACSRTALLVSGAGHATRCADSPFVEAFTAERRRLLQAGVRVEAMQDALERLNLGRLRIASKGLVRRGQELGPVDTVAQHQDGMFMMGQLAALREGVCTMAELHRAVAEGSTAVLDRSRPARLPLVSGPKRATPVAIIGMSCILPNSRDLETYWTNILERRDAVTEIPPDRWDWRRYFAEDRHARDRIYARWGGFTPDILFDPLQYGMPPTSIASIEPIQLMALEAVRAALDNAGYAARPLDRERTGVVFGAGGGIAELGNAYCVRSALPALLQDVPEPVLARLPEWTEDSFPGILLNVIAGRVANRFDLNGPNYTVDAACASSLAAIAQAVQELEAGNVNVMVVGGAEAVQSPFAYLAFSRTQALSPRGHCRPFDASADGIAISEGIAVVVLKRLADAERDGDRIYAVVRGVAGSSDGRDRSLTAPRPYGQALALRRAYGRAGVSPASIGLLEAHGTGTTAGDEAELTTLGTIFAEAGAAPSQTAIGSVKSMIGHTKAAAGLAGLVKAALALERGVLPPTMHVEQPNALLRKPDSPFYVNTQARPWLAPQSGPRRAAVSAFGFGGTNFHAVLEAYDADPVGRARAGAKLWSHEIVLLHAADRAALREAARRLEALLPSDASLPSPQLRDIAFTLAERPADAATLAIVAASVPELRTRLGLATAALAEPGEVHDRLNGIYCAERKLGASGAAFLFPGQGSQYPGMMAGLAVHFPEVRGAFEDAADALDHLLPTPLGACVFPPPAFGDGEEAAQRAALTDTRLAQPALAAAGTGALRLLARLELVPSLVAGHSFGEYVALHAAGSIDAATLLRLAARRGEEMAMASGPEAGGMIAVQAGEDTVAAALHGMQDVWTANLNAPQQTVMAGTAEGLRAAEVALARAGVQTRPIAVACAFHSPLVEAAAGRFAADLAATSFSAPRIPVFANTTAAPYAGDAGNAAAVLTSHMTSPVRFQAQILAMHEAGARVFIETGPGRTLTGLTGAILAGRPHLAVSLDQQGKPGLEPFIHALAQLAAHGVAFSAARLFEGRDAVALDLTALRQAPPPTSWLVNAARVRPATEARPTAAPPPIPLAPPAPVPVPQLPPAPVIAQPSPARQQTLVQFQDLMARFLETQQQVMLAYLGGADGKLAVPATLPEAPASPPVPAVSLPQPAPVPEPVEATAEPAVDVTAALREVVSARTGYPVGMLGLDIELEADLGIDSLKRAEIFIAMRRKVLPEATGPDPARAERLARARTLRSIVEIFEQARATPATAAPPPPRLAPVSTASPPPPPRFLLRPVRAPLPAIAQPLGRDEVILVTEDGSGLAQQLCAAIEASGARAAVLPGSAFTNRDALVPALERAVGRREDLTGVVHLWPMHPAEPVRVLEAEGSQMRNLLALAQAAAPGLQERNRAQTRMLVVEPVDALAYGSGAAAGFLKSLAMEWPDLHARAVRLPADDRSVERILAELASSDPEQEVAYRGAMREVRKAVPAPLARIAAPRRLGRGDLVVLTGGARGITAAVAQALAERCRPRLVLMGRSALDAEGANTRGIPEGTALKSALIRALGAAGRTIIPSEVEAAHRTICHAREVRRTLAALEGAGVTAEYVQADVCDRAGFAAALAEVQRRHGPILGAVHGAGVIEDRLLADKTSTSFDRVYDTKVIGAAVLSEAIADGPESFLMLFTSIAGAFGNRGQADYAAANAALNRFAAALDRARAGRVVAVNWAPWDGPGMAAGARTALDQRGFRFIDPGAGAQACVDEILFGRKGEPEVVLGDGPWRDIVPGTPVLAAE